MIAYRNNLLHPNSEAARLLKEGKLKELDKHLARLRAEAIARGEQKE